MLKNNYNKTIKQCAVISIALLFSNSYAIAQKKPIDEPREIFRYERNGVIIYGDKMPNITDIRVDAISRSSGLVTETKRYTNEEIYQKKRKEEELRIAKINQEKEDRLDAELLSRYSSENDIDNRRNIDIERISNAIQKDISSQVHIEEAISNLEKDVKKNPENKKLELQIYRLNKELEFVLENLEKNKKALSDKNRDYAEEKIRYRKVIEKKNNKQ